MFEFMLRRMKSNLFLYLLLLVGSVIAAAIFSSIPMYSNGILQRVLIEEMEQQQDEEGLFTGAYHLRWEESNNKDKAIRESLYPEIDAAIFDEMKLPTLLEQRVVKSNFVRITKREGEVNATSTRLVTIEDVYDHVELLTGSMPAPKSETGDIYEVIIGSNAAIELNFLVDKTYTIEKNDEIFMTIKVVGIFEPSTDSEYYWSEHLFSNLKTSIVLEGGVFDEVIELSDGISINNIQWRYFYDYHSIETPQVSGLVEAIEDQKRYIEDSKYNLSSEVYMEDVLELFGEREKVLEVTLWILTIPVLIITLFYTFMISQLIVKNDENEIAMLKSRGASTWQIFSMYMMQSAIMGLIAFFAGPSLGEFICNVIGASNGFLEFVNRVALPIEITTEVRMYALVAVLAYVVCILVPAFIASRTSIVQYKRNKNSVKSKAIWEKAFLDIVLLALSYYGYYSFTINSNGLGNAVADGEQLDPMIFLVSTLFLVGANLLILRIYPYIVKLVFFIGKKLWSPVMYFSLINVARAEHNSKFIMLFIMLSLSFGILNASQARTLNLNAEDRVNYLQGADVVIQPFEEPEESDSPYANLFASSQVDSGLNQKSVDTIPFNDYLNLEGINSGTKVFISEETTVKDKSRMLLDVKSMAITPHEFAKVTWYRDDILPAHINDYMNIMTEAPTAAFLSVNARDAGVEIGDEGLIVLEGISIKVTIYGFFEYFPTYEPFIIEENDDDSMPPTIKEQTMILFNYDYLAERMPSIEYEIWLDKDDDVLDASIQDQLIEEKLENDRVSYAGHQVVKGKKDPLLQGTNGILTMCFIITMLISIIGYLIFWVMTIKGRALKFGIFRAMGMSMGQVNRIIAYEQLLMTGAAIFFGSVLGIVASKIFVPMLQMVGSAESQVPPFIVVLHQNDFTRTVGISGSMLLIGVFILFIIVRRFKVNQVIKLGED